MPDMVVTDVQPHVILCPLPKYFWWEVRFIMARDSCHMTLHHGRWWSVITNVGDTVVVLDVSERTPEDVVEQLIEGSYKVWQDYFRKIDSRQKEWIDNANEVRDQLLTKGLDKADFKVERS